MSRLIKFRAWDGTQMLPLGVALKHELLGIDESDFYLRSEYEDVPLMQFTGLTDKNGKEIYEGDIVRFIYNSTPQEEHIGKVEFNTDGMGYTFDGLYIEPTPRETMEVIGNIYENKDLLV